MVDVWSVVILIAGIVVGFSGFMFGLVAASLRRPMEIAQERLDRHEERLAVLEQYKAALEREIYNIQAGIDDIKCMFREHEKHTRGGQQ
jgi:hypothetical protein